MMHVEAVIAKLPSGMKVVFTEDALHDLDEILHYISTNYPSVYVRSKSVADHRDADRHLAAKRAGSRAAAEYPQRAVHPLPVQNLLSRVVRPR